MLSQESHRVIGPLANGLLGFLKEVGEDWETFTVLFLCSCWDAAFGRGVGAADHVLISPKRYLGLSVASFRGWTLGALELKGCREDVPSAPHHHSWEVPPCCSVWWNERPAGLTPGEHLTHARGLPPHDPCQCHSERLRCLWVINGFSGIRP